VRNLGIKSTFTNNISIPVRISYQSFTAHKTCFYWGQFPLR
jgi:competence transcription factor ComK